ncbi:MAG: hypothetical protein EBS21_06120 [Sphingomonadaceae bacterium]|nr:hypothetical protein [Sphingomonadaceae bacterium]
MSILTDATSKSLGDFRNAYGQHLSPDAKAIIQGLASCGTTADLSTILSSIAALITARPDTTPTLASIAALITARPDTTPTLASIASLITARPDTTPTLASIASLITARPDTTPIMADAAEYLTTIRSLLESFLEPTTGRLRVMLDPNGGAQTLGTVTTVNGVTTVGTVTSMSQVAGVPANSMILDAMHSAWALAVRGSGIIS